MSYKLSLEEIENGFIVTRAAGKVYRENLRAAIIEVRLGVDEIEKTAKAESAAE